MAAPSRRELLVASAATFVLTAAFPGRAHPDRRRRLLRPRRFAALVAVNMAVTYVLHVWVRPRWERILEESERAAEELRPRLGREPTPDEVLAHLGVLGDRG